MPSDSSIEAPDVAPAPVFGSVGAAAGRAAAAPAWVRLVVLPDGATAAEALSTFTAVAGTARSRPSALSTNAEVEPALAGTVMVTVAVPLPLRMRPGLQARMPPIVTQTIALAPGGPEIVTVAVRPLALTHVTVTAAVLVTPTESTVPEAVPPPHGTVTVTGALPGPTQFDVHPAEPTGKTSSNPNGG